MLDMILSFHLWVSSHFKQNYFPLKLLLCRQIPKSLKRNVLHCNSAMCLMYSNSRYHARLQVPFMSVCSSFYVLAVDTCA